MLTSLGAGNQEAFQLLLNASGIAYGLAYLVMFAIPSSGAGRKAILDIARSRRFGFIMTLLYVILSVFPIIDVPDRFSFTIKISGLVIGLNLAAALFYWRAETRRKRVPV